jgi:predicted transcriptional regulator YdeE
MRDGEVIEFGPVRPRGKEILVAPGGPEIGQLWNEIIPAIMAAGSGNGNGYGIMNGAGKEGLFRYAAAFDTPYWPPGFVEFEIPKFHYLVTEVANLADGADGWRRSEEQLANRDDYELYHGPDGWSHSLYPALEVYSPGDPDATGYLLLMPVRLVGRV